MKLLPFRQDFEISAGGDWQRIIRVFAAPDQTSPRVFVPMTDAVMEIRNANRQLMIRLDTVNGRSSFMTDGSLLLHLVSEETLELSGLNYPSVYSGGQVGVGMSFTYDLFVTWQTSGLVDKLFWGYVQVVSTSVSKVTSV